MPITFCCANGHTLRVKEDLAGKTGKCPKCGVIIQIPVAAAESIRDAEIVPEAELVAEPEEDSFFGETLPQATSVTEAAESQPALKAIQVDDPEATAVDPSFGDLPACDDTPVAPSIQSHSSESGFDALDLHDPGVQPTPIAAQPVTKTTPTSEQRVAQETKPKSDDSGIMPLIRNPIVIVSAAAGALFMLLVIGGWAFWSHRGDRVAANTSAAEPVAPPTVDAAELEQQRQPEREFANSDPRHEPANRQPDAVQPKAPLDPTTPAADRVFHFTGVALNQSGTKAFVWGGTEKDVHHYNAACGPPYKIAVIDAKTVQVIRVAPMSSPIIHADIYDDTVCAVLTTPTEYGERNDSPKQGTLVRLSADSLIPEAFVNIATRGQSVEMVGDKYVIVDGVDAYSLPDLRPLGELKKADSGRVGDGWFSDGVIWDAKLEKPKLLSSIGPRSWPTASLPPSVSSLTALAGKADQLEIKIEQEKATLTAKKQGNEIAVFELGAVRSSTRANDQAVSVANSVIATIVDGRLKFVQADDLGIEPQQTFKIDEVQSTLTLNPNQATKVQYSAEDSANFVIEIRAGDKDSEPVFTAESSTGQFDIDLSMTKNKLLPVHLEKLLAAPATMMVNDKFREYMQEATSDFIKLTGQQPTGIPTALLAIVTAKSSSGETAKLEHQFLVDAPDAAWSRLVTASTSVRLIETPSASSVKSTAAVQPPPSQVDPAVASNDAAPAEAIPPSATPPASRAAPPEEIQFDPGQPEIPHTKFAKVRFVGRDGQQSQAFYLPPKTPEDKSREVGIVFSPGRGFPLSPANPDQRITELAVTPEQRQIIRDIERYRGCDRVILKPFSEPSVAMKSSVKTVLFSRDDKAAFVLTGLFQLFKINLGTWLIEDAVQLPRESQIQPCRHGILVLSVLRRGSSGNEEWIDLAAEEQRSHTQNSLFLISESLEVLATARTAAIQILGHQSSQLALLFDPYVRAHTVVNTTHWEMIDSFKLTHQRLFGYDFNQHSSEQGFVQLRNLSTGDSHTLAKTIETDVEYWTDNARTRAEKVAYSNDGSQALLYRSNVNNVLLCDVDDMESISNPVVQNIGLPAAIGHHSATGTSYVTRDKTLRIVRGGEEVLVTLPDDMGSTMWTTAKGAFVQMGNSLHWLQPHADAFSTSPAASAIAADGPNPTGASQELYEFVTPKVPLHAATVEEMAKFRRQQRAFKLPGAEYFIVTADWFDWDPDGTHFYVFDRGVLQLICVNAETNKEVARLHVSDWEQSLRSILLSQEGILRYRDKHMVMIEYKTLKPRWKIEVTTTNYPDVHIYAHPSHNYIIGVKKEEVTFYDPATGKVIDRMTADKVSDYTDGVITTKKKSGGGVEIVAGPDLPEEQTYAPQGFVFTVDEHRNRGPLGTTLMLRHETEREGKRFPVRLPDWFRTFKPHPKNPQRILIREGNANWLVLIDAALTETQ